MDKYGVASDDEHLKVAAKENGPCPSCGSRNVNYRGTIPHCPNCGVEPWERRNDAPRQADDTRG